MTYTYTYTCHVQDAIEAVATAPYTLRDVARHTQAANQGQF